MVLRPAGTRLPDRNFESFSVSQSASKSVFSYIADQEIHHRKMTFQDEFRALPNRHERAVYVGLIQADLMPLQGAPLN